jgi:hypothetical protein
MGWLCVVVIQLKKEDGSAMLCLYVVVGVVCFKNYSPPPVLKKAFI